MAVTYGIGVSGAGQRRNVTLVAGQRQIPAKTLSSILNQANLTTNEMVRLIEGEEVSE